MADDTKGFPLQSDLVRQFGSMHISGDIVPTEFFAAIRFPTKNATPGKPDLTAILILANLVYWFRPIRPRDPKTDRALAWRQKFKGEWLERDYGFWSEKFGFTLRQCKDATARLRKGNWIQFQNKPTPQGGSVNLFRPNFEKIFLTLFPETRLTFERQPEVSKIRSNVSRDTFKRQPSLLIHETNIKTSSSNSENGNSAAAAAAPFLSESHASKHDIGTVLAYLRANRTGIKNPKGLARKLWRSGEDDDLIENWLTILKEGEIENAKRRDALLVPDYFNAFYFQLSDEEKEERLERAILLYNADQKLIGGKLIDDEQTEFDEATWTKLYNRIYCLDSNYAKAA